MTAAGADRKREDELDAIVSRLTSDMSELAVVRQLPTAKALYEELNPGAKHGGDRTKQVPKTGTCLPFAKYIHKKAGISPSGVYAKLEKAQALKTLDPEAEAKCYGTALANNLGIVVRIAKLPPEVQRSLVEVWGPSGAGPKMGKAKLEQAEGFYGIERPKRSCKTDDEQEPEQEEPGGEVQTEGAAPRESGVQLVTQVAPPPELGEPTEVLRLRAGVPYVLGEWTLYPPIDVDIPAWRTPKAPQEDVQPVSASKPVKKTPKIVKKATRVRVGADNWHQAVEDAIPVIAQKDPDLASRLEVHTRDDGARVLQDPSKAVYAAVQYWERMSECPGITRVKEIASHERSFPGVSVKVPGKGLRVMFCKALDSLAWVIGSDVTA